MADPILEHLLRTHPSIWRGRDYAQQGHEFAHEPDREQHHTRYAAADTALNQPLRTGFSPLDNALPAGGWQPGTLTELLTEHEGAGEFSLLLPALRQLSEQHWIALIQPPHIPYAPALANARLQLERTLIVDTDTDTDALWATEQLLRSGMFAAAVCWVRNSTPRQQRRLQLAAEAGQSWAVAYRPIIAAKEHSPAALRLQLSRRPGTLVVDVLKSRGMCPGSIALQLRDFDDPQGAEWPGLSRRGPRE